MNIVVYKDNFATGRGADRSVLNLANEMARRGHQVMVVTNQDRDVPFSAHLDAGIEKIFVPYKPYTGVVAVMEAAQPDVIVAAGPNEILALTSGTCPQAPIVLQLHLRPMSFLKWKHPIRNHLMILGLRKIAVVQVLCQSYEKIVRKVTERPIVTIGNYTEMVAPEGVTETKTILYPAAQLNPNKNQMLLIEGFARIAREFPDWTVDLCGMADKPYAEKCRRRVAKLGLAKQIVLSGYEKNMARKYAACAFVAHTSKIEGFPLAFLEAAKCGKATLALATTDGNNEIITSGTMGLLVDNTPTAVAEGLRAMITEPGRRRAMGAAMHKCGETVFSKKTIMDQWERTLQNVCH